MSSAARAERRRAERSTSRLDLVEALAQAHDRLHRDDVEAAHTILHAALGVGDAVMPTDVAPLAAGRQFDEDFRELCRRHGIPAAYIAAMPDERDERLLAGGVADLVAVLDETFRDRQ